MSILNLAVIGTPEIRHEGQLLTFPTRKTLALLIYLSSQGGMHSREKIAAFFWPESDTTRGRGSLRLTLSYLRESLGEPHNRADADAGRSSHLMIERDFLGFNFAARFTIDLDILKTAIKQTRSYPKPEELQSEAYRTSVSELQAAADSYRGDFLEGFSLGDSPDFDDWVRLQRAVWHNSMNTIFDCLSQLRLNAGETARATETCSSWLAHEPTDEVAYRRLMQSYLAAGNRDAALRTYQTCRMMLADQLHTAPAPETEVLFERIRQVKAWRGAKPTGAQVSAIKRAATVILSDPPLVGRANEYSKLIEVYYAAKLGQLQLVTLKGEAGIGKTRLVSEFLGWAAAQGADILQGRAYEAGGQLPYQALVEVLRDRLERENAPDDLFSDVWLAELSRLLPELRDRYPDLPFPIADETTARIRLFESVTRLGQALADRGGDSHGRPLVLAIDDFQWADAASLGVLHYAGRRWKESGTPILLLLSLRTGSLPAAPALARWLSGIEHDLHSTSLTLDTLTLDDTVHLMQALAGSNRTMASELGFTPQLEEFCRWLFTETDGQPLYVMELLKALLEGGLLHSSLQEDGGWMIDFEEAMSAIRRASLHELLPPGIRQVIRTRLEFLTPVAFALLAAGAVLGHDFPFEMLCGVAGLAEHEGLAALEEVLASQLLREEQEVKSRPFARTYVFAHDKIRDVVYSETGDARRRVFHRRAFELLQAAAPAAQLAHHAFAAERFEDAFHWTLAAGDEARELFAHTMARRHYSEALECLAHLPDTAEYRSVRVEILMKNVSVSIYAEAPERNLTQLSEAVALLGTLNTTQELAGSGLLRLARLQYWMGRVHYYRNDRREALRYFRQTLAVAQTECDEELAATTSSMIGRVLYHQGYFNQAVPLMAQALPSLEQTANWTEYVTTVGYLGSALAACGRYHEGLREAQRALAIALETHHLTARAFCHLYLALTYLFGGEIQRALEDSRAIVSTAEHSGDRLAAYIGYGVRARVEGQSGQYENARRSMAQQQAIAQALGEQRLIIDDWFAAYQAEIALNGGRIEETLALAEVAVRSARSTDGVYAEGLAQRAWALALASLTPSRWDEADEHLATSLQSFESGGILPEVARTHRSWGLLCRDRQDESSAFTHLEQALAMFEVCGLDDECEGTRRLLDVLQK